VHPGLGDQLVEPTLAHQPAVVDDHHPVRDLLHFRERVAGDQHRAALGGEIFEEPAEPGDASGVEAVGRLVEHQHGRISEQRCRQPETLTHTERVPANRSTGGFAETDDVQALVGTGVGVAGHRAVHT
jgi:hypothetical protein